MYQMPVALRWPLAVGRCIRPVGRLSARRPTQAPVGRLIGPFGPVGWLIGPLGPAGRLGHLLSADSGSHFFPDSGAAGRLGHLSSADSGYRRPTHVFRLGPWPNSANWPNGLAHWCNPKLSSSILPEGTFLIHLHSILHPAYAASYRKSAPQGSVLYAQSCKN